MAYDAAILGAGIAPYMAAVVLLKTTPGIRPILLTSDQSVGGPAELILLDRLPAAIATHCASAIVKRWDRCLIVENKQQHTVKETVGLIDPAQLWLEIGELCNGPPAMATCSGVDIEGSNLSWKGGAIEAAKTYDLRKFEPPARKTRLIDADDLAPLRCPVLADFDAGRSRNAYLQYLPLGTGLTLVHQVQTGGRTAEPNERTDITAIATVRHIIDVAAACSALPSPAEHPIPAHC